MARTTSTTFEITASPRGRFLTSPRIQKILIMSVNFSRTYFTTVTIDSYQPIFKDFPMTNFIVLESFKTITQKGQALIYAFVIMKDHLHVVWETGEAVKIENLITSFRKYSGRMISNHLKTTAPEYQNLFLSTRQDRDRKIWKITKGNINIHDKEMLGVKIRYIHNNPIRSSYKVVDDCTDYYFSSALAYAKKVKNFEFLTLLENVVPWS